MPRRPYVHLAGDLSSWPYGFAPGPAHFRKLDQFSSELVDGEAGGSWDPEEPIVLGTHGATPTVSLTSSGSVLEGDIETGEDNELAAELEDTGLIVTGGNFPAFQTARTRSIVVPLTAGVVAHEFTAGGTEYDPLGIAPITGAYVTRYAPGGTFSITLPLPIRAQHRGATISSVDFLFRVTNTLRTLPSAGLGLSQFRVAKSTGFTLAALHSNAGGYDANGWLVDSAASVAAWKNGGNVRTMTYTPDQNHTSLDPTASWFVAQVQDLGSAEWIAVVVHLSSIADYRPE